MICEKKLIEALKQRIASHEKDADDFKEYEIKFDNEEMLLRLADECQAIIELVEEQPKIEKCGDCSRRKFYQKGYEDAKSKWIPVSERLPDDKDYVLVCATEPEKGVFISHYIEESNKWLYESDEGVYYEVHVIAWMPLPQKYE